MSIDYGNLSAHVASALGALKGYGHGDTAAATSLQYVLDELMAAYEAAKEQPVQSGWPLPCPFCSGDCAYEYYPGEGDHTISCLRCRARMGSYATKKETVTAWNTRPMRESSDYQPLTVSALCDLPLRELERPLELRAGMVVMIQRRDNPPDMKLPTTQIEGQS